MSGDTLKVVATTSYPGGPCTYFGEYPATVNNDVVTKQAIYCYESGTGGCTLTDTFSFGPLPAGSYRLSFELLSYTNPSPCGSPGIMLKAIKQLPFTVGTTGIEHVQTNIATIYPNPVSGFAIFSFLNHQPNEAEIQILDTRGRLIKTFRQEGETGEAEIRLDISDFKTGIYFCRIKSGKQIASGKLIISK